MSDEDRRPTPAREVYGRITAGLLLIVAFLINMTTEVSGFGWWWAVVGLPIAIAYVAYWLIDLFRHHKARARIRAEVGPDRWDPWA